MLTNKKFLNAFRSIDEKLTPNEILRRTEHYDIQSIYKLSGKSQVRGLIKVHAKDNRETCDLLYSITEKGIAERDRFNQPVLELNRVEPDVTGENCFYAGHKQRLASWRAILESMVGQNWMTVKAIIEASIGFYLPHTTRKAMREMTRDGLVEVSNSKIHTKVKLYRTTPAALDFIRGYNNA